MEVQGIGFTNYNIYITRISGPYGPQILSLAEGWLASLTSCFAALNNVKGASPTSVSPKQFFSLKLLGETPKKCDTRTYGKTNIKGGDTGHTYIRKD